MLPARTLSVAYDVGPTVGLPTGIGRFTSELLRGLQAHPDIEPLPYVLSFRADLPPGTRRLRYPARLALESWSRCNIPTARGALHGADVVHGTNYVVPPTGWPTVVSVHDLTLFERPEMVLPVVRLFGDVIRRAVDRGAFVHTISHAVAADVRTLLDSDRVRTVYPGPTHSIATIAGPLPRAVGARPFILAVGTRERRKNLPALIQAFAAVPDDVLLVLAGAPGNDDAAIASALSQLQPSVTTRILQLGYVDDATRAALFEHALVFAYPSLDEGFGLPLLEAMDYSVPIVASNAGAIPEVVSDAALLVSPTDLDGLQAALNSAVSDAALRERLVNAGRTRVQSFSWMTASAQMASLYREAAQTT